MFSALSAEPPASSLLLTLKQRGDFIDCYKIEIPARVTQAQFVEAFYTTRLFKAERFILRFLANRPSSDIEAKDLAEGSTDRFAVWRVTERKADQLLLTEQSGRTRSWLMSMPSADGKTTTLFFGSSIIGRTNAKTGKQEFSRLFHALLGLHDLYSRRLLQAAATALSIRFAGR